MYKCFCFDNFSIRFELSFGPRFLYQITRDEGLDLAFSFIFGCLFITIRHPIFKPRGYQEGRQLSISIHDWSIYWNFWTWNWGWSSITPKYRNGSFNIADFILGETKYSKELIESRIVDIPINERCYKGSAELFLATWKRSRWPFPKRLKRVSIDMLNGEEIPKPGKGENSWDCREDALHGITCMANTIEDGIVEVVRSILHDRRRHGGLGWIPESCRGN